jgi:hypothetical protein
MAQALLLGLVAGLLLTSCYSTGGSAEQQGGGGQGAGGTRTGSGGSAGANEGGEHSGGFGALAGFGGSGATAGTGGGDGALCRSSNDCGGSTSSFFECVPPGVTPTPYSSCGAPQWCGQCSCGPEPLAPYGTGQSCGEGLDACPSVETTPGFESYAGVCGADLLCTACVLDGDCSLEAPRCAPGRTGFGTECFECLEAVDCPAARPHCVPLQAFDSGYAGGACQECVQASDCALGICLEGTCQPQCETSETCASEFLHCSAAQRCEPPSCLDSSECAEFGECAAGLCSRRLCASDRECEGGACVNGACYSGAGSCVEHFAAP